VTERSGATFTSVDAISAYNDRLSVILDNEKAKDETQRTLEKQLYADKLKHAELIADVSYGHELMELEEKCDEEYTALEEAHERVCAPLREALAGYEEAAARLSLADVEGVMLQAQLQAAKAREDALQAQLETMASKLETLKANEKTADVRSKATLRRSEEVRAKHAKEFDRRPSNQDKRKGTEELKTLVGEVQRLRSEHFALMKKLHNKEAQEIKLFEDEAALKLRGEEDKFKSQFSKEELRALQKHEALQKELKHDMDRLEEKMKAEFDAEEKNMRAKIKKLSQQQQKSSVAIETMRQQVVDFLADRNVHETQAKHLDAVAGERGRTVEKLAREEAGLRAELAAVEASSKASAEKRAKVTAKYATVVKQNKKMSDEIAKYSALVKKGETELDFSPPSKRIRLQSDKLA
jgi:chromosome segregation ATPase